VDLALSISLKPREISPDNQEDVAELDGDEVRDAIVHALGLLGTVRVWDTAALTPAQIASQVRPDIIFNLSEGLRGTAREAQAPALFEWLQWPYVGSDPVTLAITLDKWYTKSVLRAAGIPTARALLAEHPLEKAVHTLRLPLILKPVAEGSGKGVYEAGVVESVGELLPRVRAMLERYRQPVLIEEFLPGREFTVALMGNVGSWEVLPIVEVDFQAIPSSRYPMFGYEAKWGQTSFDDTVCPAPVTDDLRQAIETSAVATCDALRVRDWARVDIRLDEAGTPNVLEVNALPGILPGISDISCFTRAAYAAGLSYEGMIHRLVHTALDRYRSSWYLSYGTRAPQGATAGRGGS
jgi:D-alanine-D-alanine ligase